MATPTGGFQIVKSEKGKTDARSLTKAHAIGASLRHSRDWHLLISINTPPPNCRPVYVRRLPRHGEGTARFELKREVGLRLVEQLRFARTPTHGVI